MNRYTKIGLIGLLCILLLSSCKTVYVPVESVHTDTLYVSKWQHDSVFIETLKHDSVTIREKGDTILIDRWHTEWRDRWKEKIVYDTTYISKVDSIQVPYPVEKKISFWKKTKIYSSAFIIGCIVSGVAVWIRRRYKRC